MDLLLKDKIVVITGGTKGIGLATAKAFAKENAKIIVGARKPFSFDEENIEYRQLDVSDFNSCKDFYEYIISKYKKIDVLVNNAGILHDKTTKKMSLEEFDNVINVNLKGTFNMTKIIGSHMQENKCGSIINLSSCVTKQGNFGQANYVASKSGIEGMTKCWAKEFAIHGENVRVNAVAPGPVLTDIFKDTPKEIVNSFSERTTLRRLGNPEEIANVIVFLASDVSSYITGEVIHVDGGGIDFFFKQ